jgi:hypothetical protein
MHAHASNQYDEEHLEQDFKATSVNYDLAALLAQAEEPE